MKFCQPFRVTLTSKYLITIATDLRRGVLKMNKISESRMADRCSRLRVGGNAMETKLANFGSYEWIHNEIQRRAAELGVGHFVMQDGEDPYVVASREIFEELLRRSADVARAHAA